MNLTATKLGLAMKPWSQTLQEYPEMSDLYKTAQNQTGTNPAAPLQMLVILGYAKEVAAAPRRALKDLLIE
jgi:hypothetical protein